MRTCHGYGTNIDFNHKNEIADTKPHNILHTLKYLGITGYSRIYNRTQITCNQDNQSFASFVGGRSIGEEGKPSWLPHAISGPHKKIFSEYVQGYWLLLATSRDFHLSFFMHRNNLS